MEGILQRNSFAVQSRGGVRNRKLTDNDLELIETLKASKGSIFECERSAKF